jgi:DNA-binding transcriptional MerR regulator
MLRSPVPTVAGIGDEAARRELTPSSEGPGIRMEKSAEAFRTISEVADDLDLPQHVLRFWETRFVQIKPLKRAGGRRFYRPEDVELLRAIRRLLYGEGYTIKGVQKILKEQGVRALISASLASAAIAASRENPPPLPQVAEMRPPEPHEQADDYEALRGGSGHHVATGEDHQPYSEQGAQKFEAIAAQMEHRLQMGAVEVKTLENLLAELQDCQKMLEVARR